MRVVMFLLLSAIASQVFSQHDYPSVGTKIPDFVIRNMMDDRDSLLSSSQLRGEFVILDFWTKLCSACAGTFPGTEKLYREYNEKISFILVGLEDKEERMRPMFEKIKRKMDLTIPFAFDSVLFNRFVPGVAPHLVWIDDHGIVKAITGYEDLTPEHLDAFLERRDFQFYDWSYEAIIKRRQTPYDYQQPFLTNGNGGDTDLYVSRSLIVPFNAETMAMSGFPNNVERFLQRYPKPWLLQGCLPLEQLYFFAFTGYPRFYFSDPPYHEFFNRCILELKDTSAFIVDALNYKGFYWYSLLVPPDLATKEHTLTSMRNDLKRSFGYNAKIERRRMPCWVVRANAKARRGLKTKGGDGSADHIEPAEVILTNVTIEHALSSLFYKQTGQKPPIINRTRINSNVDIRVNANLYDFEDIRSNLTKIGLHMRRSSKKMSVIVITD